MPVISNLIKQWRCWINRSRSFEEKELDELESHLLEDIDHLVEKEGISEEEAFNKAVIDMGIRENLDQEFTKVRGFPVKKVKHWFAIHSWIIGAVIVGLLVSSIDFSPKEKPLPFLEEESIGYIYWPNDFYTFPKSIPIENKAYFYDSYHSNLFYFKIFSDSEETNISMNGSYFNDFPQFVNPFTFDIDNQGKFYFLCSKPDTPKQNVVFVYSDSQIESSIMLPHIENPPGEYDNINVINNTLFLTRNYYSFIYTDAAEPNITIATNSGENQINTTTGIKLIRNEIVYIDLDDPVKKVSVFPIDKEILAMDQSGNKLAILTCGGNITIYSFESNQLSETKKMKIDNFSEFEETLPSLLSMMYCENNDQIVLKLFRYQHLCYYLQPIDHQKLKVISLQKTDNLNSKFFDCIVNVDKEVLGVLKINYNGRERIVFCKKGKAPNWANSDWDGAYMFLFK